MTQEELLKKIKSRGHWRIHFEPLEEMSIPLKSCKELVENNSVELRGWDYPHIPRRSGDDTAFEVGENFWQAWVDWEDYAHYEFWRFYQSGQFIHYREVNDDWQDKATYSGLHPDNPAHKPGDLLGVTTTTFLVTEIYQFLAKLGKENVYEKGVKVSISLQNTKDRKLYVDSLQGRFPFSSDKKTIADKIEYKQTYTKDEIITQAKESALNAILYIFERFNWDANVSMITSDQEKLLARKL
jgi:hypothetical protein